jgi:two-component system response regulator HydG
MAAVLIIEDDVAFAQLLVRFLQRHGHVVSTASRVQTGISALKAEVFELVLLDYRLPDGEGWEVLQYLRGQGSPMPPVIVMTTFNDVKTAVRTIRSGASDYITKPVNPDELLLAIKEATTASRANSTQAVATPLYIEGASEAAIRLQKHIALVAPTDFSVIIQGESGTGKELAARMIHAQSKRRDAPFVALDCGVLSQELAGSELFGHVKGAFTGAVIHKTGMFEAAHGGTLFLDEVGNLSYEVQVKLLRALQERTIVPVGGNKPVRVDVRIIAATNDDLRDGARNGRFREDLYHRLNEFGIDMPPLRERRTDIPLFVAHLVQQTNTELGKQVKGVTDSVMALFMSYEWPGNLRELRNIVKRAVLTAETNEIDLHNLPQDMQVLPNKQPIDEGLKTIQADNEKELIVKALADARYNKAKAARLLHIDRTTLYYKMNKYNIS